MAGFRKALACWVLVVTPLLIPDCAYAQYVDWIGYGPGGVGYTGSGSSSNGRRPIAFDAAGNTFVVGWMQNLNNMDPLIVKYDPDGAIVWQRRLDTPEHSYALSVVVNQTGDVFVFAAAAYVVKYSAAGEQLWRRRLTHPSGSLVVDDLAADEAGGGYLVTGTGGDHEHKTLSRFNESGETLWTFDLPGHPPTIRSFGAMVKADGDGNAYVCESIATSDGYRPAGFAVTQVLAAGNQGWRNTFAGELSCADFTLDQQARTTVLSESPGGLSVTQFNRDGSQRWSTSLDVSSNSAWLAVDTSGDLAIVSGDHEVSPQLVRLVRQAD